MEVFSAKAAKVLLINLTIYGRIFIFFFTECEVSTKFLHLCLHSKFVLFQQSKQSLIQALVKQNSNARARVEKQKHEVHVSLIRKNNSSRSGNSQ